MDNIVPRNRIDKHSYYMAIAEAVKERSHDSQTQFGCVFVRPDGSIASTGFNGFIRGAHDENIPNTRPDKYPYVLMGHAELNAIWNAARNGVAIDGCICYVRGNPCINCARAMWQCGIKTTIVREFNSYFDECGKALDIAVDITPIHIKTDVDERAEFYQLDYRIQSPSPDRTFVNTMSNNQWYLSKATGKPMRDVVEGKAFYEGHEQP